MSFIHHCIVFLVDHKNCLLVNSHILYCQRISLFVYLFVCLSFHFKSICIIFACMFHHLWKLFRTFKWSISYCLPLILGYYWILKFWLDPRLVSQLIISNITSLVTQKLATTHSEDLDGSPTVTKIFCNGFVLLNYFVCSVTSGSHHTYLEKHVHFPFSMYCQIHF